MGGTADRSNFGGKMDGFSRLIGSGANAWMIKSLKCAKQNISRAAW